MVSRRRAPTASLLAMFGLLILPVAATLARTPQGSPASETRPRVIVSTDIGGTDPDDFQSMVHFLLYADMFDVEGLVSSPYGPGRREHILGVLDRYAADYPNLKTYSDRYPAPDVLRGLTRQGAIESAPPGGVGRATEGSDWIVRSARRNDPRPLWVLVWGGIDDLAQALHDAPDILPKLRVYFIGGPNKMWSVEAYDYIERQHPGLWMIEANSTYRGWFTGGNQAGEWGNAAFVAQHVAGRGALGAFFATQLGGSLKMGDSPVGRLSAARHAAGSLPPRVGRAIRARVGRTQDGVYAQHDGSRYRGSLRCRRVQATRARGHAGRSGRAHDCRRPHPRGGRARWRRAAIPFFTARCQGVAVRDSERRCRARWSVRAVHGRHASPDKTSRTSRTHPRWWTDDPDPAAAEGVHAGAKHVSRWREAFLRDFAARLDRAARPVSK